MSRRHATTMLALFPLLTAALLAACGETTKPDPLTDITGSWFMTSRLANTQLNLTCNVQTPVSFQQTGTTLSGQFNNGTISCTGPGGTASGAVTGPITGTVTGNNANFSDDGGCSFTGTVSGTRMQGSTTCNFDDGQGGTLSLTGTWSATGG